MKCFAIQRLFGPVCEFIRWSSFGPSLFQASPKHYLTLYLLAGLAFACPAAALPIAWAGGEWEYFSIGGYMEGQFRPVQDQEMVKVKNGLYGGPDDDQDPGALEHGGGHKHMGSSAEGRSSFADGR